MSPVEVAIDTVLEARSSCADRDRAEAMLASALSSARGPRHSAVANARWELRMSVSSVAPGTKVAEASITDDSGRLVAERSVTDRTSGSCVALVHAVTAWAQVVLDDELVREHDAGKDAAASVAPADVPPPVSPIIGTPVRDRPLDADESLAAANQRRAASRPFEVGTMLFIRNGAAASGAMFGVAPFITASIAEHWLVRPSVMYGSSTSRAEAPSGSSLSSLGARVDICRRVPGNYLDHRGIEVDFCMGSDGAAVWSRQGAAFRASVGPSAVLRGELGYNLGLEFRAMGGVSLDRRAIASEGELPPVVAAFELGGSVRFE